MFRDYIFLTVLVTMIVLATVITVASGSPIWRPELSIFWKPGIVVAIFAIVAVFVIAIINKLRK